VLVGCGKQGPGRRLTGPSSTGEGESHRGGRDRNRRKPAGAEPRGAICSTRRKGADIASGAVTHRDPEKNRLSIMIKKETLYLDGRGAGRNVTRIGLSRSRFGEGGRKLVKSGGGQTPPIEVKDPKGKTQGREKCPNAKALVRRERRSRAPEDASSIPRSRSQRRRLRPMGGEVQERGQHQGGGFIDMRG